MKSAELELWNSASGTTGPRTYMGQIDYAVTSDSPESQVTLFEIRRHDLAGESFETRIAAQGVEHRLDFDQARFRKLFVLIATFEPIARFVLITKAKINQGKAKGPDGATLLKFFHLREHLQRLFAIPFQRVGMGQVC